ncbi:MAG TPA: phBC6A51 family helix-turn-helix protein [Candidatus Saccharibacteria bacterium]|nr:phBC6A51 family helix-turn-helix protein [Candidatus Saccharibacteria bacterium]
MSRNQEKTKKEMIERLQKTPIVEVVCKQIGMSRATYYRWRKDDEDFATACDEAIVESAGRINDMAESQLIAAIKDQNMTAIIFWLKHHHPAYEARIRVDGRITHKTEELTTEQTELVEKALKNAGLLLSKSEVSQ